MKELSAHAAGETTASIERSFELLSALEDYPRWYPAAVTAAEVLERGEDGLPTRARANLHLAAGFLERDFRLNLAVVTERPARIELRRIPHDDRDRERFAVLWSLSPGVVAVDLRANLSVPGFLPVGGIGESLARGFLDAALAALA